MERTVILLLLALAVVFLLAGCSGGLGRQAPEIFSGRGSGGQVFPEEAAGVDLPAGSFQVLEFAPTGVVPWENVAGGIWVLFNQPVVPLSRLGEPLERSETLRIEPALEGVYRWYGSRLLSFEPQGSLEPATEYTVSVDPRLASLEGRVLAGMNAFRFRTPPLRLVGLDPSGSDVPPESSRELLLQLNYPVELRTIRSSLRVLAAGRSWPFELDYDPRVEDDDLLARRMLRLRMKRELPWNTEVRVLLAEGARPAPGHYGTAEDQSLGFGTLAPLALRSAEVQDWQPVIAAVLVFNHPLREEQVLSHLEVGIDGYTPAGNIEVSAETVILRNLPVQFESILPVKVRSGLADIYGQELERDILLELEVGPAGSYARFRAEGDRILEAGFPPVAVVEFQNAITGSWSAGKLPDPYGPLPDLPARSLGVEQAPRNTRIFRVVDFTPFLNEGGKGSVFARWNLTVPDRWSEKPYPVSADLRLQVTDLAVTSHIAHNRILLRVSRLSSGRPAGGVEVFLRGAGRDWKTAVSGPDGLVVFELEPGELARRLRGDEESLEVMVRQGDDRLVFRPAQAPSWNWNYHGLLRAAETRPLSYLVLDRGIYRPGETLSFFGIDRDIELGRLRERQGPYRVALQRGWSAEGVLLESAGTTSPSGRFWGEMELPDTLEPDEYFLVYSRPGGEPLRRVPVRVAFFRRVNFSVAVELPGAGAAAAPHLMGGTLRGSFSGEYLAGGAVRRGGWRYWWARRPISWSPPDPDGRWAGFRFGVPVEEDTDSGYTEDLNFEQGALGGDGTVPAVQELAGGLPGRVYEYTLTATIEDVDRQAISRQAEARVFSSALQIGARLTRPGEEEPLYFVGQGEPFRLTVGLAGPDGTPFRAGGPPVELAGRLLRENWKVVRERATGGRVETRWVREEIEEERFALTGEATRDLQAGQVGYYVVELRGRDDQGREALTRLGFYSTGSANVLWRRWDENRIELVPDRPSYAPGEKARLLIKSPLERGSYLLTVEREGILEERVIELDSGTATVDVEIRDEHLPLVYVSLSGWRGRTAPPPDSPDLPDLGQPRGCFGLVSLPVRTDPRRIELAIESRRGGYRPGQEAEVVVRATREGRPLAGVELALLAVDRGVLDLTDYHIEDPLEFFYTPYHFPHGVAHYDTRSMLMDPVAWKVRDLPGGDKEGEEAGADTPLLRRDFRATAVFEPALVTGQDGTARLRFRLPDQLTTFRVTAVAAQADRFGLAESELRVQNPLNVRAALPRRLRRGDEISAGVVITNLDGEARSVVVRLESDLLEIRGAARRQLTLAAGETRELPFDLAAPRAGSAGLRFAVESEVLTETLEAVLEVEDSLLGEAFTVIGRTEGSVEEGLAVPERFLGAPWEGLALTLDSTVASSLAEAVRFLDLYPYDCLEQRLAKLFAWVLYDRLLEGGRDVEAALADLPAFQTPEGGLAFWSDPGYRVPDYYVSARAAHLLHLAGERGYRWPAGLDRQALLRYLGDGPAANLSAERKAYLAVYGLYVRALYGHDARPAAGAPPRLSAADSPGLPERILAGLTFERLGMRREAAEVLEGLRGFLRVGTRSVTLAAPVTSGVYYGGEVQAKALLLMLYGRLDPGSPIAQALADDLLAAARRGHWSNTSDTGWVLQAFSAYLAEGGEGEADFLARVSLGGAELARAEFRGLSRRPFSRLIEPPQLLAAARQAGAAGAHPAGALPLTIGREGRGRLYYTATLRYALEAAEAGARDEGLGLYVEILDEGGRRVDGDLELGRVYRLQAVVSSTRDRDFLALRLPLPSGAEAIDGSLETAERVRAPEGGEEDSWRGPIRRILDNEVRFVFETFARGRDRASFFFRTTTPGRFVLPPARAELMYEEEVFGRTDGRTVRIVP